MAQSVAPLQQGIDCPPHEIQYKPFFLNELEAMRQVVVSGMRLAPFDAGNNAYACRIPGFTYRGGAGLFRGNDVNTSN